MESPAAPEEATELASVEEALVALQKTLSRVNRDTRAFLASGESPSQGVAALTDTVTWQLTCQVKLEGDRLVLAEEGGMPLQLSGQLQVPPTDDLELLEE